MEDPADSVRARLLEIAGPEPSGPERALLSRILISFTTKTPAALERLTETLFAGDVTAVQDQAHALKGSAANIGARALTDLFAELEQAARDGHLPDPRAALDMIHSTYQEVEPVCTRIAGELQQSPPA